MTATVQDQLRESLLAAGRDPLLQRPPIDGTVVPSPASEGYDVRQVSRAHLQVSLSESAPRRTHVHSVPTFDAASTYVLTVGGRTFTEATPASLSALMTDMQAQLADATTGIGPVGGSSTLTDDVITMLAPPGPVTWTATGGSPDLLLVSDAESCVATLEGYLDSSRYGSHITDAADLRRATAWATIHNKCGEPVSFNLGVGGLRISAFPVEDIDYARWYITSVAGNAGDSCTPGTLTIDAPLSLVIPDFGGTATS